MVIFKVKDMDETVLPSLRKDQFQRAPIKSAQSGEFALQFVICQPLLRFSSIDEVLTLYHPPRAEKVAGLPGSSTKRAKQVEENSLDFLQG